VGGTGAEECSGVDLRRPVGGFWLVDSSRSLGRNLARIPTRYCWGVAHVESKLRPTAVMSCAGIVPLQVTANSLQMKWLAIIRARQFCISAGICPGMGQHASRFPTSETKNRPAFYGWADEGERFFLFNGNLCCSRNPLGLCSLRTSAR
jgi:hypothetical protein